MTASRPPSSSPGESGGPSPKGRRVARLLLLAGVLALAVFGYVRFGDSLTLESLAEREEALRDYRAEAPWLVIGGAFAIYVAVTGLSLPGATVLTLAFGWFFGFWQALLLVSFASTGGATLAFLFSRYLLRDAIQSRFGGKLARFNEALEREGSFYLFTLRLIPVFPFFVINLVMGLTPIRTWTFWWVSQVGMLAGTAVYVYAGSSVPNLADLADRGIEGILTPRLVIAFVVLGLFPLAVKKIMGVIRARRELD